MEWPMAMPGQFAADIERNLRAQQAAASARRVAATSARRAAAADLARFRRLYFDAPLNGDPSLPLSGAESPVAPKAGAPAAHGTPAYVGDLLNLWAANRAVRHAAMVEERAAKAEIAMLQQVDDAARQLLQPDAADIGRSSGSGSAVAAHPVVAPAARPPAKAPPAVAVGSRLAPDPTGHTPVSAEPGNLANEG